MVGIINYIVVMLISIFGLLFYHNYAMLIVLIIMAVMPFYSNICAYIISKRLKINLEIEQASVAKNHNIYLKIRINNPTFFSTDNVVLQIKVYNAFYNNDEIFTIIVPASAKEIRQIEWEFSSKYSGRIIASLESAKVKDVFRVFTFNCDAKSEAEIIVMPDSKKLENNFHMLSEGEGEQNEVQYRKGTDVSEISEIREYIPGDKLQSVHWKLSAKQDKMMVKEYGMPYTNEFIIIPELYFDGENPQVLDDILDNTYSYALSFLESRKQFYLGWLNVSDEEIVYQKVESDIDIPMIFKQLFYVNLQKNPEQTKNLVTSLGRIDGKSVVYVGKAVSKCLS